MDMTPRIVDEESVKAEEDTAIRTALCRCFPANVDVYSRTRGWHGSLPSWSIIVEHEGQVVAHVGIVERKIRVGDEDVLVAGVMGVLVVPEHRKKHLFRQIMTLAMEEAYRRSIDLGILFCTPDLVLLYGAVGWRLLDARPVTRIDEEGFPQPLPAKNVTMFHPLRRKDMPPGDIHLQGNDW
jgi:predicted N-acetyltransferase YhbS